MDSKIKQTLAIGSLLAMSAWDNPFDREPRQRYKPKAKNCRSLDQVKRRKKNRMANKSRAINFKRAR